MKVLGARSDELHEIDRLHAATSAVAICSPNVRRHVADLSDPHCILASPTHTGLVFWGIDDAGRSPSTVELPILGEPWELVAGTLVRCDVLTDIMPSEQESATWCLLLAGWDGSSVPIATVALDVRSGLPRRGAVVRPSLDVPMDFEDSSETSIIALDMERGGRLSVLFKGGKLEMWSLFTSRHLGSWEIKWEFGRDDLKPTAICSNGTDAVFAVGRSIRLGPVLLRTELQFGIVDQGVVSPR